MHTGASRLALGSSTLPFAAALLAALCAYAALAYAVVDGGALVELDLDVARWVAGEMPASAEWVARPLTWLGGLVGMTLVVSAGVIVLLRRNEAGLAALLIAVAVGAQVLVIATKQGYGRLRPEVGSAIELPSSFAFPSGHATVGVAVLGLLGLLAAREAPSTRRARATVVAALALGVVIGASRVILNVHYLSDVLAGFCLGLAWLIGCVLVFGAVRR